MRTTRTDRFDTWGVATSRALMLTLFVLAAAIPAFGQEDKAERVRVPKSHANVHSGASTARPVLVLVPQDTVLRVVGRRGEWLEVELDPELRDSGMVMRWYDDEQRGWIHDSTVEPVDE